MYSILREYNASLQSFKELAHVIKTTFFPSSAFIIMNYIIDIKMWISEQTAPLHSHLKAHHFKFQQSNSGCSTKSMHPSRRGWPYFLQVTHS